MVARFANSVMSNSTHLRAEDLPRIVTDALIEALRQVGAGLAIVDGKGALLHQDGRMRELSHLRDGTHPPAELLARLLADGEATTDSELALAQPDGPAGQLSWSSWPVRAADGGVVGAAMLAVQLAAQTDAGERLAYFDALLRSSDDAIVGTDADFRVTIWSAGAEELYGYSADEALGRPARELASYTGDASRTTLEGELTEGGKSRMELTAVRPDGQAVEVEMTIVAVRDDAGEPVGYLGVHRDVSERKRGERDQARLASIVRNSEDFIGIAGLDGTPQFVNAAGRRLVGFGDRDLGDTHLTDWFVPEDRDYVRDVLVPLILERGRWPAEKELHLRHWDTEEAIPAAWDAFRIDDPHTGEPTAIATITRDLRASKQAEAAREAAAQQQSAVAMLGLKALTGELGIEALIEEAATLVARTLEVRSATIGELVEDDVVVLRAGTGWPPEAIGTAYASAGRESFTGYVLIAAEPVVSGDLANDSRFARSPMLDTATQQSGAGVVIHGPDAPFGVLTVFSKDGRPFSSQDVTFLQSAASVLAFAIERSRTEQKVEAVRKAERRRLARALHDEALTELAVAATRARDDPDVGSALGAVTRRLRAAIYDLRLDDEEHRPLRDLLATLVEVHRDLAEGYEIVLEIDDTAPAGSLGAHGIEVVRILGEALTNARRHSGARNVRVRVWRSAQALFAEVSDDGSGMVATPEAGRGRGTGIVAMRERAGLIGAELDIRGTPGEGTTVCLEVPLSGAGGEVELVNRVLLVEDHVAVREAMATALSGEPGVVVAGQAGSLSEARGMLRDVDVAVLDLGLPDGFGADLISDLRSASPRGQALVLSATLDYADVAQAVDRGAAGVLDKTASLSEVVAAVKKLRAGETLMPPREVTELLRFAREERERERIARLGADALTQREREVLQLLADGLNTQQISERLHISMRTHRNHVAGILGKLGVHSQLQAVLLALRLGLVEIDGGA